VRVKAVLKRLLPQSVANMSRRREETRALAAVPIARCDVSALTRDYPALLDSSDWSEIEQRLAFGGERAQAVNPGDQRLVYVLTRALNVRDVLEIGTNVGGSTVMFALAMGDPGHLTTVDIVDVNGPEGPARRIGRETPAELIRRMGLRNVQFVRSRSTDFMQTCDRRFDLIFLDGAHEADVVYREVPLALGLLKPGGIILMHDVFPNLKPLWSDGKVIPGPWLAIDRLRREGAAVRVEPLGRLPWVTKQGSNVTSLALLLRV